MPTVVYDDWNRAGSARAWWVLTAAGIDDVRILDGGLSAWSAAGEALQSGPVTPQPGDVDVVHDDLYHGAAAAVRVLVLSADVETVVIGGGLTALGDRLENGIRAALHAGAEASPFMRSLRLDERIELLPAGSPAAAFGAALVGASITEKEIVPHG